MSYSRPASCDRLIEDLHALFPSILCKTTCVSALKSDRSPAQLHPCRKKRFLVRPCFTIREYRFYEMFCYMTIAYLPLDKEKHCSTGDRAYLQILQLAIGDREVRILVVVDRFSQLGSWETTTYVQVQE